MYNSSATVDETPNLEIEAASLDKCKDKLFRMYGEDYKIIDYRTEPKRTFFGLGRDTHVVVAKYILSKRYINSISTNNVSREPQRQSSSYVSQTMPIATRPRTDFTVQKPVSSTEDFLASRDNILNKQASDSSTNMANNLIQTAKLSKQLEEMSKKIDSLKREQVSKEIPPAIVKIDKILEQNEFSHYYIEKMNERIRSEFSLEDLDDFDMVQDKVLDWIGENIHVADKSEQRSPNVVIIVGPTGVGKTSTIAKLATEIKRSAKRNKLPMPSIHMITTDAMRVAALEQIEHYGDALEAPVEKAENQEDLETLYKRCRSSQVGYIFIDTSGFSPNDFNNIAKMKNLLDVPGMHPETYLAVAASTKLRDLEKIIRNYEPFDFKSIIVTKCDETSTYGNVLSVLYEKNKKISLITTSQDVLHGLQNATPYYFLKALEGFNKNEEHIKQKFGQDEKSELDKNN